MAVLSEIEEVARPPQSVAGSSDPFAGWDNVPLFMKSLPKEQGGISKSQDHDEVNHSGNTTLDALQALIYDGDPSEIAAGFKKQANDLYARKKFKDAVGFYTRALVEVGKDLPIEEQRILWCNRAAANLELGNNGACLRDTSLVLSSTQSSYPDPPNAASNKTTLKALLRSARALSSLDKLSEALDALLRLRMLEVELGEDEKDLGKIVREEVEEKVEKKERSEKESTEKERRKQAMNKRIKESLLLKGVALPRSTGKAKELFANCPIDVTPPHYDPDSLLPENNLDLPLLSPPSSRQEKSLLWQAPAVTTPMIFPVFLLLPLAQPPTRDLCLSFHTSATFGDALESMEHDPSQMQLYISTYKGRVLQVGAKLTLGKVLEAAAAAATAGGGWKDGDGWEMKEGWALEMVGVPKGQDGENWIKTWKEEVKAGAAIL